MFRHVPVLLAALLATTFVGCTQRASMPLTPSDRAAIESVTDEFSAAWVANDTTRVMAVLSEDAVLIPHHGASAVEGKAAIENFWWPADTAPATVTTFDATIDEITGGGNLAFVRGRFVLAFEYEGAAYRNEGNYAMLLRRDPQGTWRITHRIWNDPPPNQR